MRQRLELGPGTPLGVLEQLAHHVPNRLQPVPRDERLHTPHARRVRGDLRAEVPARLVLRADLRQDEPEDVVDDRAPGNEPDGRDDDALLEHLLEGADRGGRPAAHVDVVREVRDVPEQLVLDEDGGDQADVVQVHAARVRVVRDDDVAGAEPFRAVALYGPRHLLDHRAEVHRLRKALGDRAQLGVEERAREVRAGLDVRRVRAPLQREHHLVGGCDERVPDHLEGDGVDGRAHARSSAVAASSSPRPASATRYTSRARATLTLSSSTSRTTRSGSRSSGGP